jgi:O-antigen/teichoic acid export membrane protein
MIDRVKTLAIATRLYWSESRVIQDSSILYFSNLVTAGVSFISSIIVARALGPSSFAIIAAYNAIALTLIGFTDFGLGTGLIKHATPLLKKDMNKAVAYLRAVFYVEILIGLILFVLGMIFAPLLPKLLGQGEISLNVVRLAVISASIASGAAFVGAALATYKKFKLNALTSILFGSLKLISTIILWKANLLSIQSVLLLYVFLSVFNAVVGFIVVPKDYLKKVPLNKVKKAAKNIFHFSAWLTLSFFISSIMGKLDFFFIFRIKGAESAGIYAASQQLGQVYALLLGAIATVLTSHVSEKISYKDMREFLNKSLKTAAFGSLAFVASGFLAPIIINIIFGQKYALAVRPLQFLIIHFALNLLLLPFSLLFIPLGKVKIGTLITVMQLLLSLALYPLLIRRFGISGAAITVICATMVGVIIYPIFLRKYMNDLRRKENA